MSAKRIRYIVKYSKRTTNLFVPCAVETQDAKRENLVLLLDTGADSSMLDRSIFKKLGLSNPSHMDIVSASGIVRGYVHNGLRLVLDEKLIFENVQFIESEAFSNSPLDGVIGMDIIGRGNLEIINTDRGTSLVFTVLKSQINKKRRMPRGEMFYHVGVFETD